MNLITNRTGGETYEYTDLNRVEAAVEAIVTHFDELGIGEKLTTKTDWEPPGDFSENTWPISVQMPRYLGNITKIKALFSNSVRLPSSMDDITYTGANNIEKVLQIAMERIEGIKQAFLYSGEIYAGEE